MKKQKFQTTTLSKLLALTMLGTLLIPAVSGNQTPHTHTVSAETSSANETVVQITSDTELLTSSTNLLTGNNTTFETGVGDWTAFGGGTIQSTANPDGDGNVLKFSSPSHTWDTPAIDIKSLIQSNATKEAYVKVVMSIYSPSDVTVTMKIRVAEADDLSIATNAGIDYFAYLWYDTDDAMSQARKAHLQSDKKDTIEMCAILETIRTHSTMQELYAAMQEDYYLKVEGMPVVFLYTQDDWTAEEVLKLRQDAVRAGVDQALYIVGMISGTYVLEGTYDKGFDALSWYGTGSLSTGITYQELAQRCDDTISRVSTSVKSNGIHMVPNFTTGMDTRARIQTGASWISGDPTAEDDADKPYMNRYALSGTAEEIAAYAGTVLEWTAEN